MRWREYGRVFFCGDVNGRIGERCSYDMRAVDYEEEDFVCFKRKSLDKVVNANGESFEVLNSAGVVVVNGVVGGEAKWTFFERGGVL